VTPAARYQASIELWDIITKARIPMDTICGDYFRNRRYIGSKDRADIAARVYLMMRAYARLSWWIEKSGFEDTPRARVLLMAILLEQKILEDISHLFNGRKYHPESLSNDEQIAIQTMSKHDFNHPDIPVSIANECPDHALESLQHIFGDDFEAEMQAMMHPATLDIRVNTILASRDKVKDMLAQQDVLSDETPYSPVGLRLQSKAFLSKTKAFAKGMIEIQDEGSQILGLICNAKPGMQVMDYCAGGGGKTLALAASMEGKGRIVAMDIDGRRLAKAKPRLTKAQVHNVELRPIDDEKNRKWLRRQKGNFDIVLIDAPCTSSGTWRRNPDLRWNTYGPSTEEIQQMQADILRRVHPIVKVGGRLIYATCSLFKQENEEQIEKFLQEQDNFKIIPVAQAWEDSILQGACPVEGDYLRLTPHQHQTDGFFAAILERTS
jgi:16S rRNA (cytosine967-C5)-methyltransferase